MLFLFRSAPEVEKRIHSKFFCKFWRSRGTKEPAYITVVRISHIVVFFGLQGLSSTTAKQEFASSLCNTVVIVQVVVVVLVLKLV